MGNTERAQALAGIKVADFSRVLAGPYIAMLLGDLGAEVVKVERPGIGDDTRSWKPPVDSSGRSSYFQSVNRSKVGVVIDLKTEDGKAAALALIFESDVVIENFGAGVMESFGLGWEEIKAHKPGLVYCSITGFGDSDRARNLLGYDLLAQGLSGLMSITGDEASTPMKCGVAVVDVIAGLHAGVGILSALNYKNLTGVGQRVDINLLSSALSALVNQSGAVVNAAATPRALGNDHPSIAPYGVFKAQDREIILAVGNDDQFTKMCRVLGVLWFMDPRYSCNLERVANLDTLKDLINSQLKVLECSEWVELFTTAGVPAARVNNIAEGVELATMLGLEPVVEIIDNGVSSFSVANPIRMSHTPAVYRLAPPSL